MCCQWEHASQYAPRDRTVTMKDMLDLVCANLPICRFCQKRVQRVQAELHYWYELRH